MISIIISSYKDDLFDSISINISKTIGIEPYEIIRIYNPNKMSIAEAYNSGAKLSQYDFLLFLHEDVQFLKNNWGYEIVQGLSDERIGLIGLAGASAKSKIVSGWNTGCSISTFYNVVQHSTDGQIVKMKNFHHPIEVVTIDGFFMATRKKIFLENPLDEKLISGYHGYDLYLSLSIGLKFKIVLLNNIEVEHFSIGTPNKQWWDTNVTINNFFKDSLPRYSANFSVKDMKTIEFQALKVLIGFNLSVLNNVTYVKSVLKDSNIRKMIGFWNYLKVYIYFLFKAL